jgi:hypothetical protein
VRACNTPCACVLHRMCMYATTFSTTPAHLRSILAQSTGPDNRGRWRSSRTRQDASRPRKERHSRTSTKSVRLMSSLSSVGSMWCDCTAAVTGLLLPAAPAVRSACGAVVSTAISGGSSYAAAYDARLKRQPRRRRPRLSGLAWRRGGPGGRLWQPHSVEIVRRQGGHAQAG